MQKILVVEDDLDIQELLKNFLQEAGYSIVLANDGAEALSIFSNVQFDLILLDIMLPKIDGFVVCELIRKQSQVPIIMLTALNGEEEQIRGLDLQVDDYITKPFSMPVLIRKIAAVLRISNVSKKMAELDFSWQCEENRIDELGTLAHSLNEMSQKLSAAMTELKCANEKLHADIERERALEQAQLDFFSAVSHELKTPITVIKGQTEGMILNIGDYQDRNKYLARSLEVINTMENMVQEILTVSCIKSLKVGLKKETIQFSDILKQEYALFEDLIIQKSIDWNETISPDLCVVGDKMLIQKVINNLISNAVIYSPEKSAIYLTAFVKNGEVWFLLENSGVHIPDTEIPRLFDAFYRVEYSRNKRTGGSGLGLYIVKTILDQHQAKYSITNTEKGVLFTIQL